jgi:hypothetical protein
MGGGSTAATSSQFGVRKGWVVNTTLFPVTPCTGGCWVDVRGPVWADTGNLACWINRHYKSIIL